MKRTIKVAAAMAMIAGSAAAANLENPLYMPRQGDVYSKISAGLMYKKANDNLVMQAKDHAGATEFPIWRGALDIGYGITDRLAVRGQFAYTHDGDINRQGMNNGRLGLIFRALDGRVTDGWIWDVYADAHLGGISKMEAELIATNTAALMQGYPLTFNYDNYSNGRWGVWAGTRVGKTFDNLTVAAFGEVLHTFGNDNTNIKVSLSARDRVALVANTMFAGSGAPIAAALPNSFAVETKSTWEYNVGVSALYQIDRTWSVGGGFTYKNRAENNVKSVDVDFALSPPYDAIANGLIDGLTGPLQDGIKEYILTAVVAYQLTDIVQVAIYGEYTFDDAQPKSQNGTDVKVEGGVRMNIAF